MGMRTYVYCTQNWQSLSQFGKLKSDWLTFCNILSGNKTHCLIDIIISKLDLIDQEVELEFKLEWK